MSLTSATPTASSREGIPRLPSMKIQAYVRMRKLVQKGMTTSVNSSGFARPPARVARK